MVKHPTRKSIVDQRQIPYTGLPREAICREPGCENLATALNYCRAHYIKNWKLIKHKQVILSEGKLKRFIEYLFSRYPRSVILAIRNDLFDDEAFERVRNELGLHHDLSDLTTDSSERLDTADEDFGTIPSEPVEKEEKH